MIETAILLFSATFLTLPSLISHRQEKGKALLRKIVIPQGVLGLALAVVSVILLVLVLNGAAESTKADGPLPWLTRLVSDLLVFLVGFVLILGFALRLVFIRASAEARERSEKTLFSLVEFQTAAGFFCLIAGVWVILYEVVIAPLLKV